MPLVTNIVRLMQLLKDLESLKWCLVSWFFQSFLFGCREFCLQVLLMLLNPSFNLSWSVPEDGDTPMELDVYNFKGPGIALAMYNVDEVCLIRFSLIVIIIFYVLCYTCFDKSCACVLTTVAKSCNFVSLFELLLSHPCQLLLQRNGLYTWAPKTPFLSNMMAGNFLFWFSTFLQILYSVYGRLCLYLLNIQFVLWRNTQFFHSCRIIAGLRTYSKKYTKGSGGRSLNSTQYGLFLILLTMIKCCTFKHVLESLCFQVWTSTNWWHGGLRIKKWRWICLGL